MLAAATLCLPALFLAPQDAKPAKPPQEQKAVAARTGSLRATLKRKGHLVPADCAEVKVEFDGYSGSLKVVDVLPHGSPVNAGDILVRFDTEKIDDQIEVAAFALRQAEKKFEADEEAARLAQAAADDQLQKAERELAWARRRLEGFLEHEWNFDLESERLSRQYSKNYLEDQRDELTQLEKMYKEDELVDATEEIVLKRARRDFAQSQASNKLSERRDKYQWDFAKAMQRERLELDTAAQVKAFERARKSHDLARTTRELGRQKARHDLDRQKTAMAKLRRDREKLTVRAERSGLLLHGEKDSAPGSKVLKVGGTASADAVLMTIAAPERFDVRTDVPETHVFSARTGKAAEIRLTALPKQELTGAIRVELLPSSREGDVNLYRTVVPLAVADPRFRPGMGCSVTIVLDVVDDAVLVPKTAVVTEDGENYVHCGKTAAGPHDKRKVETGPDDGKDIVITRGLTAGEFVVKKPEAKK